MMMMQVPQSPPPAGGGRRLHQPYSLNPSSGHMAGPTACRQCGRSFEPYGGHYRVYCKKCTARADKAIVLAPPVKCRECGKKFTASHRSSRYCSDACRAEGARRYNREYMRRYIADPEKRAIARAHTRASAAARKARKRGGRPTQRQAPLRVDPSAAPSVCRLCGRTFAQYGRGGHADCKRCAARVDRKISRPPNTKCKECGKKLNAASRRVRYCSKACSAEGLRRSCRESARRAKADPEKRALAAARGRAWSAFYKRERTG